MRKRRSDRTHIIYSLRNSVTGEEYIGLTVAVGRAYTRSVAARLRRHIGRALSEDRQWALSRSIRQHGPEAFSARVVELIRGKAAAHRREVELIRTLSPALNTASRLSISC